VSALRAAAAVDPEAARRAAQRILSDRRFRSSPTPRPLRGPLRWLADRIENVFGPVGRLISMVSGRVWLVALAVVVVAVIWIVMRRRRRRSTTAPAGKTARGAPTDTETEDPDALERAADAAERDGDLARAVRLRFRAGLLRLGDRGAIRYRPSVTTGEVRTTLRSQRFDDLAGTFEAVAYGGRAAGRPDVDASRREWPHVLEEAGRP
jgi:hypothetical protein